MPNAGLHCYSTLIYFCTMLIYLTVARNSVSCLFALIYKVNCTIFIYTAPVFVVIIVIFPIVHRLVSLAWLSL